MKIVQQFLRDVEWGELDYFIVDLPPGTGDAQLSLVQATQVAGAVIVTTPQEVAVGDALRGAKMFERVGVPVFGIVENMSGVRRPRTRAAGSSSSAPAAADASPRSSACRCSAAFPLQPRLAELADAGRPILDAEPESPAAVALRAVAEELRRKTAGRTMALPDPARVSRPLITLLTDFGTADSYVAEMKGVLLRPLPEATPGGHHPRRSARATCAPRAYLLGRTWHRFPAGTVHLAVVDPGVGTARAALALRRRRPLVRGPGQRPLHARPAATRRSRS